MTGDDEQVGAGADSGGGDRAEPNGSVAPDVPSPSVPSPSVGSGPVVYPGAGDPRPGTRKKRRWPWIVVIVVVLAVAVASRVNLNYYAIQPGTAQSVQQFITVPPAKGHPVRHPVLLTDVEEGRVTALSYLVYKLQSDTALYPLEDVTGGTPPSQLDAQGALEMSQAEAAAKAAALRHLGYKVTATPSGAVIAGTFPGTPAYPVLDVGDVVTAVDGAPTPDAVALTTALSHHHSGQSVTLTVRKGGTAPPGPVSVTLKRTVINLGGVQTATVDLGIQPEDQIDFTYPFPVHINVTNIGGPSAGLAMTLGVIDALDKGSLTGDRTVAATGTIDDQGNVGAVGGVPQKTIAVENAGASIFFVPVPQYNGAMSKDRPGLKIYPVSTLDQVLAILAAHGGSVPKVPSTPSRPSG